MMKLGVTWKIFKIPSYVASLLNSEHTAYAEKKLPSFPKLFLKIYHLYYNPAISWLLLFSLCFNLLLPLSASTPLCH